MIADIKAEFRKLLTVRSTYVITAICLAFTILIAFYALGYRLTAVEASGSNALADSPHAVIQFVGLLLGLVGILMITHEYRYNTIMYTLTAARRRWQTLASKIIVITTFAVVVGAAITIISPYLTKFGVNLRGTQLAPQDLPLGTIVLKSMLYCWGCAMFGAIIATLIRVQAGAIVIYLLMPLLVENILVLLLKDNTKYLPFTALSHVVRDGPVSAGALSYTQTVLVVLSYIVVGWLVTLVLFNKRDAN